MFISIVQGCSFAFLIAGPFVFGLMGRPTEMGISVVAAALSLAFSNIDKISRFKGAGFEAEMREQISAIVAKEAEPETNDIPLHLTGRAYSLDERTKRVVTALGSSQYTWRTVSGIGRESGLTRDEIIESLQWLKLNNLIIKADSKNNANWGLSEEGRNLFNQISSSKAA